MSFFLQVAIGVCLAVATFALIDWKRRTGAMSRWYHWVLVAVWTALVMVTIGFIGTALGAGEPRGALVGGVVAFGLLCVISGVGLWRWLLNSARSIRSGAAKKVA